MQTKICPKCAGRGIVPHRHVTNKRNRKECPHCEGNGEVGIGDRPVDKPRKA